MNQPVGSTYRDEMMTALFTDRDSAERAYDALKSRGYDDSDTTLLMSDETRKTQFSDQHVDDSDTDLGDKALEGAGTGSAIGGTVGAVAAAIAAIGTSLVLPGIGLVVAGPLAAAFAGAGAGGLAGGLIGALVGSGMSEDRAKEYETHIKNGSIGMGVKPKNQADADFLSQQGFHY
ncbi:MAG: hypothetical protein H7319_12540 [Spirosoma sp.]|nr:hypothetical protein [Spirosoma sp.]